jgi:hypothetical protein
MSDHPRPPKGPTRRDPREQRTFIVSILVAAMTGIAFQEMVVGVGDDFRRGLLDIETVLLAGVFCLTAIRFFVGAALHLTTGDLLDATGFVWMYDLLFILFETLLLIFLGGSSSIVRSNGGFTLILVLLLVTDMLWVASQWAIGRVDGRFRRRRIPWEWFWINAATVTAIVLSQAITMPQGVYGGLWGVVTLGVINVIAFVVDLFTVDQYGLL